MQKQRANLEALTPAETQAYLSLVVSLDVYDDRIESVCYQGEGNDRRIIGYTMRRDSGNKVMIPNATDIVTD